MTLFVRDEQDIIRDNIEFHLVKDADYFIATDNKSEDLTSYFLQAYEKKGIPHYIFEGVDDYNQHAWVTRIARMAYVEQGADLVINNESFIGAGA